MDETDTHKGRTNVGGLNGAFVVAVVASRMYKHLRFKYEDQYSYCVKFRQECGVQTYNVTAFSECHSKIADSEKSKLIFNWRNEFFPFNYRNLELGLD